MLKLDYFESSLKVLVLILEGVISDSLDYINKSVFSTKKII